VLRLCVPFRCRGLESRRVYNSNALFVFVSSVTCLVNTFVVAATSARWILVGLAEDEALGSALISGESVCLTKLRQ